MVTSLKIVCNGVWFYAKGCTNVCQSFNSSTRYGVIFTYYSAVFILWYIFKKRTFPPGIPNEAYFSLLARSWNHFRLQYLSLQIFLIRCAIFMHLSGIRCRVKFSPSIKHPNISFIVVHVPSTCAIFSVKLGLCLGV